MFSLALKPVTRQQLNLAGKLSFVSAILDIPQDVLKTVALVLHTTSLAIIVTCLELVYLLILVFIFITFRNLLVTRFKFKNVSRYITVLIWLNIIGIPLTLPDLFIKSSLFFSFLSVPLALAAAIYGIILGVKLLKIKNNLYGLLKPYSYLLIIEGICGLTILLSPIVTFLGVASDIIIGLLLLRAAKEK